MRALISVSDKTGIVDFAKELIEIGYEIVSTGGTANVLKKSKVPVIDIDEVTDFPEMLDGRVKTLHPKIHAGLLALRENSEHIDTIKKHNINLIDLVVVNLYPFEQTVAKPDVTPKEAIENIDIGGPSMIRSAAKNFQSVGVVTDPNDYDKILDELKKNQGILSLITKEYLAKKAFSRTAEYDLAIATYLAPVPLRYGENPHQKACYIGAPYEQLQGKELSFNNIIDIDAATSIVSDFDQPTVAIIKHTNPCGVSCGGNILEAYKKAKASDPISAFGSIVGVNREITTDFAEEISKLFVEVIVAPSFSDDALLVLQKKKNLRLILLDDKESPWDYKRTKRGFLAQERDNIKRGGINMKFVTKKSPENMSDLDFAWKVCRHVKSNAIVLAKNLATVGIGAGQMSRIDALDLSIKKAKQHSLNNIKGSVMASDAFFPFRDVVDIAAEVGVEEIIQPGGSIRDEESISACNENNIAMVFTGERHFNH